MVNKKVLHINSVINTGSTGKIVEGIGRIANGMQWESFVTFGRDSNPTELNSYRIGNNAEVYKHVVYSMLWDRHGLASDTATKRLIQHIVKENPDIIHLHNIHGYFVNYSLLADFLNQFSKPIVWTLHDCWTFTGHCAYFDFVNCQKWKTQCHHCPQLNQYPKSLFLDNSENNYKLKKQKFANLGNVTLVTPSEWLSRVVQDSFMKNHNRKVINNGIDLNIFQPTGYHDVYKKYNITPGKKVILGVAAQWSERKGLKFFKELAKKVNEDEQIVLVGLDSKTAQELPHSIIKIARTESATELAQLYTMADVFVNPTLDDNFPTTNLEALACGTPIVTFNVGGSPESVTFETGYVTGEKTADALYLDIQKVLKVGRDFYQKKCVDFAAQHYNQEDRFKDYVELYESLIKIGNENSK